MRAEIITAKCDRKECKTMIEVERSTVAPEGWLQVTVEIDGKWDNTSKLEFCSAKCVSLWAKARGLNPVANGNGNGDRSTTRHVESEIREAIAQLSSIQEEFKSFDVQELSGITQSTVDRHLGKLVESKFIQVENPGSGKPSDPRTYSKVLKGGDA